jgi:hypothetical protein
MTDLSVPVIRLRDPSPEAEEWDVETSDEEALAPSLDVEGSSSVSTAEPVPCIEVAVRSSALGQPALVWLPIGGSSEVLDRRGGSVRRMANHELREGLVLLRVDDAGRTSVYDQLVQVAHAQPEYRELEKWTTRWQQGLLAAVRRYTDGRGRVDYRRLLRDLREEGADIQTELAVRNWVDGTALGPGSVASIRAVGTLAESLTLRDHPRRVYEALEGVRALHRAIGQRVSRAMAGAVAQASASQTSFLDGSDILDARVVVPLEELLAAVDFCEIVSIDVREQLVPPVLVGRLRREAGGRE